MYYEIKKVLSRRGRWIALLFPVAVLILVLYFMLSDTWYTNSSGNRQTGFAAIAGQKAAVREWSGLLTEERFAQVIEENHRINSSKEHQSEDVQQQNIAYSRKQGIKDILYTMGFAYGSFQDWNYAAADSLTKEQASEFYPNRVIRLKEWLAGEGADGFREKEKQYLIRQYEALETPYYYEYQDGWKNLFQWSPTIIMITTLVLAYLCAGIFADEFRLKAGSVFYSSCYGRGKAVRAKVKAGFLIATAMYWMEMLLYSAVVLEIYGTQGINCPIQSTMSGWKSFYNITNGQEYLLVLFGGYLGCIFMTALVMLVSAAAKSSLLAVMVPFVLIFLPSFLGEIRHPLMQKILGLLPDQLLQMNAVVKYFNLYGIGGKITGAAPVLLVLYSVLLVIVAPVIYVTYRRKQVY